MINLTKDNFDQEVKSSEIPVVVDFWAEWCAPCKMLMPILEELEKEISGKVKIAKVNIDEAKELAEQFQVMSIPTLIFFKGGEVVDQNVGALPKEALLSKIQEKLL